MFNYICRQEEDDSPLRGGSSSSQKEDGINSGSLNDDSPRGHDSGLKEDGIDSGSLNDDSPPRGHDSGRKESLLDSDSLDAAREDYLIDPPLSASLAAADDASMPFSSMNVDGGDWEDEDDLFGS